MASGSCEEAARHATGRADLLGARTRNTRPTTLSTANIVNGVTDCLMRAHDTIVMSSSELEDWKGEGDNH